MSKPWIGISLVLFLLNLPIVKYGTITPCGILKERFKSEMLKDFTSHTGAGPNLEASGGDIWLKVGDVMIDEWFTTLSPLDCAKGLIRGGSYDAADIQQQMSRRRAQAIRQELEKWSVDLASRSSL